MDVTTGERVRSLRKAKGWRQRDLADAAGVKQGLISGIERNSNGMSVETAWRLSDALGCTIDELVGRAETVKAPVEDKARVAAIQMRDAKMFARAYDKESGLKFARDIIVRLLEESGYGEVTREWLS